MSNLSAPRGSSHRAEGIPVWNKAVVTLEWGRQNLKDTPTSLRRTNPRTLFLSLQLSTWFQQPYSLEDCAPKSERGELSGPVSAAIVTYVFLCLFRGKNYGEIEEGYTRAARQMSLAGLDIVTLYISFIIFDPKTSIFLYFWQLLIRREIYKCIFN